LHSYARARGFSENANRYERMFLMFDEAALWLSGEAGRPVVEVRELAASSAMRHWPSTPSGSWRSAIGRSRSCTRARMSAYEVPDGGYRRRIRAPGPKRMLALDGGGFAG